MHHCYSRDKQKQNTKYKVYVWTQNSTGMLISAAEENVMCENEVDNKSSE